MAPKVWLMNALMLDWSLYDLTQVQRFHWSSAEALLWHLDIGHVSSENQSLLVCFVDALVLICEPGTCVPNILRRLQKHLRTMNGLRDTVISETRACACTVSCMTRFRPDSLSSSPKRNESFLHPLCGEVLKMEAQSSSPYLSILVQCSSSCVSLQLGTTDEAGVKHSSPGS